MRRIKCLLSSRTKSSTQTKMIAESQTREQEYAVRLQEYNNIKELLDQNERALAELNAENVKQQVTIAQLQASSTSDPTNSQRNKRPRTTSENSNIYYSGPEDNDNELPTSVINNRSTKLNVSNNPLIRRYSKFFKQLRLAIQFDL